MLKNGNVYPGATFQVSLTVTDNAGVLTNPATVALTTLSPAGTETAYVLGSDDAIQQESIGVFLADITPDCAGRWRFRWVTTVPATVYEDSFVVRKSEFSPYGDSAGGGYA